MKALTLKTTRAGFKLLSGIAPGMSVRAAARLFSTPRSRPVSPQEKAILDRGEALRLSGLAATAWGVGPTVLLVHGWERHRASLSAFVIPLVERGLRVVAFDAPAHNDSPGRTANPIQFTEAILGVANTLGPLRGVVSHSMGGGATVMALHEGLEAQRVVLLAPASDWEYQMRFFATYVGLTSAAADRFVAYIQAQAGRSLSEMTPRDLCAEVAQPVLLFHDHDDARVPYSDSVDLQANLPHAELVPLEGLGHSKLLRASSVIERAVDFLSR